MSTPTTVTADPFAPVLGLEKGASSFQDGISIARLDDETSGTGNSVLRVGRTVSNTDHQWTQSEHVVLSPADRRRLVARLLEHMDPIDRQELLDETIDTESSNSRQHFVDTGAYLTHAEAAAYATLPQHVHHESVPCNVMCPANPNTVKA